MYKIMHTLCGMPALNYTERPLAGDKIERSKARRFDNSKIAPGEYVRCGTCNNLLRVEHLVPDLITYDMTSTEDMEKFYGPYRHEQ